MANTHTNIKNLVLFSLIIFLIFSPLGVLAMGFFKDDLEQKVLIKNEYDCPVQIIDAKVYDSGFNLAEDIKGIYDSYQVEVQNVTDQVILSYTVEWLLKNPYDTYFHSTIVANSIKALGPTEKQELEFKKEQYYRDDIYYFARIKKAQFDDGTIWEIIEEEDELKTKSDLIRDQINANGDTSNGRLAIEEAMDTTSEVDFTEPLVQEESDNKASTIAPEKAKEEAAQSPTEAK